MIKAKGVEVVSETDGLSKDDSDGIFNREYLDRMELTELDSVIDQLSEIRAKKKDHDLKKAWQNFVDAVNKLDMDIETAVEQCLAKTTSTKRSLRIKYRDPENPENVWAGRGKTPKWLSDYEVQGRSKSEFKVK